MAARVSLVGCSDYSKEKIYAAVKKSVDLLGGIKKYVTEGDRVLLKVNLLSAAEPSRHVTTHPSVVEAVVKLVQSAGGCTVIGDSPSGVFTKGSLKKIYLKTGMQEVADESGAELNYDVGHKIKSNPKGRLLKAIEVSDYIGNADKIISLPKLKTHTFMQYTGAVKNMFGAIPGVTKVAYHGKMKTPREFAGMLVDLIQVTKPDLVVMDGIVGMEGNGPNAGDLRELGVLLAGDDSFALDTVALGVVGWDPMYVPYLKAAADQGVFSGKMEDIRVLGDSVEDHKVDDFKKPTTYKSSIFMSVLWKVTPYLTNYMIAYPKAKSNCVRCGVCAGNCPVKAIEIRDKAVMDYSKCIRCYCCHETCPHDAIELRKPVLARLIR